MPAVPMHEEQTEKYVDLPYLFHHRFMAAMLL